MIAVLIGLYLVLLKCSTEQIGMMITAGLAGAAFAVLLITVQSARLKNRLMLLSITFSTAILGVVLCFTSGLVPLALVAFFGMLNGMGRDRGACLVLEQAMLPITTTAQERTMSFAWYNVIADVGHSLGSLAAALPALLVTAFAWDQLLAFRAAIGLYAVLILVSGLLYFGLSSTVDGPSVSIGHVSEKTRAVLWKISSLFALDSLGGGFLTAALVSVFFFERFHVGPAVLASLYFGARVANAVSHLGAAWLARRIGLLNTMVFTHIPSSFLLLTVAFAPNFPIAAALFLLREGLVEMDVPTRQSYVMALVEPQERAAASGITHLVRLAAWAVAPVFAGFLMQTISPAAPLMVAAGMKVSYDVILYFAFRRVKPPEEQ
jgi:predicted MFS family arabinose efflux permease